MRTTDSGQSALLLLDIIQILDAHRIPYAVVGAFAVAFYGMVRASLDADAIISTQSQQEADDLCRDLRAQGLSVEYRRGNQDDPIAAVINIQDLFHNRVDLLMGVRGMTDETFDRIEETQFMDTPVKIISREDLVAMKIFSGSSKDIEDVIGVLNVSGEGLDQVLVLKLASQYGRECVRKLKNILRQHFSKKD